MDDLLGDLADKNKIANWDKVFNPDNKECIIVDEDIGDIIDKVFE